MFIGLGSPALYSKQNGSPLPEGESLLGIHMLREGEIETEITVSYSTKSVKHSQSVRTGPQNHSRSFRGRNHRVRTNSPTSERPSPTEGAAQLGVAAGTFKTRVYRAKKYLINEKHLDLFGPLRKRTDSSFSSCTDDFSFLAKGPSATSAPEAAFS
jgi:hypothetical protein